MLKEKVTSQKSFGHIRTTRRVKVFLWVFLVLSFLITLAVGYQTMVKTTVSITRNEYPIQTVFSATFAEIPVEEEIEGIFSSEPISVTYENTSLKGNQTIEGKATGTIRVINTWSQNQTLAATTRFLSPDGVLFRSTERIDVPPGGEASVTVIADEKGGAGDIDADTRFTIPGLWAGLQEQIYGINDDAFTGGIKKVAVITQKNLDEAEDQAIALLSQGAEKNIAVDDPRYYTYVIQSDIISRQASATAGDQADTLLYTIQARYITLQVPQDTLSTLLMNKLFLKLVQDEELISLDTRNIDFQVDRIMEDDNKIQLRITAKGTARLSDTASVFTPVYLQNKTEEELYRLADQETGIASISATFSPFWMKKTPSNPSRIHVTVQ